VGEVLVGGGLLSSPPPPFSSPNPPPPFGRGRTKVGEGIPQTLPLPLGAARIKVGGARLLKTENP